MGRVAKLALRGRCSASSTGMVNLIGQRPGGCKNGGEGCEVRIPPRRYLTSGDGSRAEGMLLADHPVWRANIAAAVSRCSLSSATSRCGAGQVQRRGWEGALLAGKLRRSVRGRMTALPLSGSGRCVSSAQHGPRLARRGEWEDLSESERAAWQILGWSRRSWDGSVPAPLSALLFWKELSTNQQAAAQHGLGWTPEAWDANMHSDKHDAMLTHVPQSPAAHEAAEGSTPPTAPGGPAAMLSGVVRAGFNATRLVAPLAAQALQSSRHPMGALVGHALSSAPSLFEMASGQVPVVGVETCVYLDDSGSMTHPQDVFGGRGSPIHAGRAVLAALWPMIKTGGAYRVLKFGSNKTLLVPRDASEEGRSFMQGNSSSSMATAANASLVAMSWNGSSGGTYMWHMIEHDVLDRYVPSGGKLRLVIITDGEDTLSPRGYSGVRGMDPMMRNLLREGYDIEWFVVVLGKLECAQRYRALAAATGGAFLLVENFEADSPDAATFLSAFERSNQHGKSADTARWERQRQYELDVSNGHAKRFDWYKALPPPPGKGE